MAAQDSALRLKFLQNSASLLSSQSVASAAHLMSLHNRLLHEDSRSIKPRQHEAWCGACGSPRKASHTKVAKITQRTGKGKSRPVSKSALNGAVVFKCLRCSRRTIQDRRPQTRPQQQKTSGISTATQSTSAASASISDQSGLNMASTSEVSTKTTLENASSKKRAKARKQGGLQALLASKQRSQESKPSGSSLDLFDFLQQ